MDFVMNSLNIIFSFVFENKNVETNFCSPVFDRLLKDEFISETAAFPMELVSGKVV